MNLKFINTFDDFQDQLDNGEVVIAQEAADSTDRIYLFIEDGVVKLVTTVEEGVYVVKDLVTTYENIADSMLYVVIGTRIVYGDRG